MVMPLVFQDELYIKPFNESLESDLLLGFVAVKHAGVLVPTFKDLYSIGTTGRVLQYSRDEKSLVRVVIEGRQRFKIKKILDDTPYHRRRNRAYQRIGEA